MVETITRSTNQTLWRFLNFSKVDTDKIEMYILCDFNINLRQSGHHIFQKYDFFANQSQMMSKTSCLV